jgi:hypothetical protein
MNNKIQEIIARLRNNPDKVLAITWVANNYSKLDLVKDLEEALKTLPSYEDALEIIQTHIDNMKATVASKIKELFPEFPSEVASSVDDRTCFIIRVFNVPEERTEEVNQAIYKLDDNMFNEQFFLAASVKSVSVTNQYYPEYSIKGE